VRESSGGGIRWRGRSGSSGCSVPDGFHVQRLSTSRNFLVFGCAYWRVVSRGGSSAGHARQGVVHAHSMFGFALMLLIAPIRSSAELDLYLAQHRNSPLHQLRPDLRQRFIESFVFTKKGLASYSYLPLERLSVTEAYRLLSLFGVQSSIGGIRGLRATNASERTILEASSTSIAANPDWKDGICVIHGPAPGICHDRHGSNCSRACD